MTYFVFQTRHFLECHVCLRMHFVSINIECLSFLEWFPPEQQRGPRTYTYKRATITRLAGCETVTISCHHVPVPLPPGAMAAFPVSGMADFYTPSILRCWDHPRTHAINTLTERQRSTHKRTCHPSWNKDIHTWTRYSFHPRGVATLQKNVSEICFGGLREWIQPPFQCFCLASGNKIRWPWSHVEPQNNSNKPMKPHLWL